MQAILQIVLPVAAAAYVASVIWRESGQDPEHPTNLDFEEVPFDQACQDELDALTELLFTYKRTRTQVAKTYNADERALLWSEWHTEAMRQSRHFVAYTPEETLAKIRARIGELVFLKT